MKGGGAQTKHKATGISSRPGDIDLVLMLTNIDGLQSGGAKIQGWVSQSEGSIFPPLESVVLFNHKKRKNARSSNEKSVLLQLHSDIYCVSCHL